MITDLKMEGMDGVEVLRAVAEHDPDCPAMIITAFGTVETAVEAMKIGAFDFLQKPFAPEVVRLKVERALELRMARKARQRAASRRTSTCARENEGRLLGELVGSAPCMAGGLPRHREGRAHRLVGLHLRRERHRQGAGGARDPRKQPACSEGPFIKVNCGALTDTLLESELFGHEKGAFTGAIRRKLGRFELADGGTLFLDEIGDVSAALQLKLLRVLQEQEFERVGGEATIRVDVRVISATNKNLQQEVQRGALPRGPLLPAAHRPDARSRPCASDARTSPLLVSHFIGKLAPKTNPEVSGIDDDALGRLMSYSLAGQRPRAGERHRAGAGLRRWREHHRRRAARVSAGRGRAARASPCPRATCPCRRSSRIWSAS